MNIIMLIDYRGQFYSSIRSSTIGMNLNIIKDIFNKEKIDLKIIPFKDVDFNLEYNNTYVLYQSSEDKGLLYKSFIADILLGLKLKGAEIIPDYKCFHAHHNKSFQEILRNEIDIKGLVNTSSLSFGCKEEFIEYDKSNISYPVVLKSSEGCRSKSVSLNHNQKQLLKNVKKISKSIDYKDALRFFLKRYLRKGYIPESNHRNKFILQEFIPNLTGDYKVLIYGDKYYVLTRNNRKDDFRASGSGLFEFQKELPIEIFRISKAIKDYFKVPFISLDIAYNTKTKLCYLIEFQFIMFGTYTLERSKWYFEHNKNEWNIVENTSNLEKVFSESIISYLKSFKDNI